MTLSHSTAADPVDSAPFHPGTLHGHEHARQANKIVPSRGTPIALMGVPFDNVTTSEAMALVERMVASGRPHYLATANVDFLVQSLHDIELRRILFEAHLVLCDGTPLIWASRWLGNPLSERVAGSDLVPLLIRLASERGYRVYFLGGSPSATVEAVAKLQVQYPNLVIAGHYSPPFRSLLEMDHEEIGRRIQAAKPDLLFVSFGCPKQEKWIAMHYRSLRVPVSIGVGGTIDFLAGRLPRAPLWMQRTGTEWLFRLVQEPRRLFKRYAKDLFYFGTCLTAQWCRMHLRSRRRPTPARVPHFTRTETFSQVDCPEWLDAEAVEREARSWEQGLAEGGHLIINLAHVQFIDSTGVGLLIRLRKRAALHNRELILLAPSAAVTRSLRGMRLWPFFQVATDSHHATVLLKELAESKPVAVREDLDAPAATLVWQGEITAANAEEVWLATEACLNAQAGREPKLHIDLSRVNFIDSTGVGLMVRVRKHAVRQRTPVTFLGLGENVLNVVRLARLEAYLEVGAHAPKTT